MKRRICGLSTALVCAGLAVPACSTPASLGPAITDAGGGGAPSFAEIPPDSGEAGPAAPSEVKMCVATECTWPFATCDDGLVARCNVDLLSDDMNCGACGHVCEEFRPHQISTRCTNGTCKPFCSNPSLRDCNGLIDDGCETQVAVDVNNCGVCGNECAPGELCFNGQCGCPVGTVPCNGTCVDTQNDPMNCGHCGNVCPWDANPCGPGGAPPNTILTCAEGKCGQLRCGFTFRDCNGDMAAGCNSNDGCEVDITSDPENCGGCNVKCAPGQICAVVSGQAQCLCGPSETLCGDLAGPFRTVECADLSSDPMNCGACGHVCPHPGNTIAVCEMGVCGLTCPANRADCNGDWNDGCETDLLFDMRHCGACGNACDLDAGQPCSNGSCLTRECGGGPT